LQHILNSNYKKVETFLDNDTAWKDATNYLLNELQNEIHSKQIIFKNKANLYKWFKDLNEYILARQKKKVQDLGLLKEDLSIERTRERK
jgi:hypothetical protein